MHVFHASHICTYACVRIIYTINTSGSHNCILHAYMNRWHTYMHRHTYIQHEYMAYIHARMHASFSQTHIHTLAHALKKVRALK
jgi:hypothetical protein